jgi:hypothetical protein
MLRSISTSISGWQGSRCTLIYLYRHHDISSYTFGKSIYRDILSTEIWKKYIPSYTRYMIPYDRAWDMPVGSYTEYMWVYDGMSCCQDSRWSDRDKILMVGRRPARSIAAHISRLDWRVLKIAPEPIANLKWPPSASEF